MPIDEQTIRRDSFPCRQQQQQPSGHLEVVQSGESINVNVAGATDEIRTHSTFGEAIPRVHGSPSWVGEYRPVKEDTKWSTSHPGDVIMASLRTQRCRNDWLPKACGAPGRFTGGGPIGDRYYREHETPSSPRPMFKSFVRELVFLLLSFSSSSSQERGTQATRRKRRK